MAKRNLVIYEGAMCCSTGICGPEPDKILIEFNEALKKLHNEYDGLEITRASMTHNLNLFLENKAIFQIIKEKGSDILPITTLDGNIIAKQKYMKYEELKRALGNTGKAPKKGGKK